MTRLRLYILHLSKRALLERAFERVLEARSVASCSVEPCLSRLRFVATRREGDALVEQIYLEGGLSWCSRHDLRGIGAAVLGEPRHLRPAASHLQHL